jgi:putative acetyltransferase
MASLVRSETDHADFKTLVAELDNELWDRYPDLQDQYAPNNKVLNIRTAVIAYDENKPVGIGCFRPVDTTTIEIKRMFVLPAYRGKGIAGSILKELETWARELSFTRTVLESGDRQPEALHLYEKSGYAVIENYGPYVNMESSICMGKQLQ